LQDFSGNRLKYKTLISETFRRQQTALYDLSHKTDFLFVISVHRCVRRC